jgi:hypothetical protein
MAKEKNATTTWKRIRDRANDAIQDLIQLAQRLPNENQEQIFNTRNMEILVNYILFPLRKDLDYDELDARRTRLAAILAEKALSKSITQFTKVIQTRQEFYEDFIHGLQKSIHDSKVIATEVELKQSQTKQYTLTYKRGQQ